MTDAKLQRAIEWLKVVAKGPAHKQAKAILTHIGSFKDRLETANEERRYTEAECKAIREDVKSLKADNRAFLKEKCDVRDQLASAERELNEIEKYCKGYMHQLLESDKSNILFLIARHQEAHPAEEGGDEHEPQSEKVR